MESRRRHRHGCGFRHHFHGDGIQGRQSLGATWCMSLSLRYAGLRHWDHAAIYWHIAGSYSPLTLIALRTQGYWGWSLFIFVWACAIAGTIISFVRLKEHSNIETFCYIGMGLSVLVAFKPLIDSVSTAAVVWIIAEGVSYITGAIFYSFNKKRYEVYALRLPFLRPYRQSLPHHCRLGRTDGISLKKYYRPNKGGSKLLMFHSSLLPYFTYSEKSVRCISPLRASVSCIAKAAVRL